MKRVFVVVVPALYVLAAGVWVCGCVGVGVGVGVCGCVYWADSAVFRKNYTHTPIGRDVCDMLPIGKKYYSWQSVRGRFCQLAECHCLSANCLNLIGRKVNWQSDVDPLQ